MPAWQMVDPLPVLGFIDDEADTSGDGSLENLVTKSNLRGVGTVQGLPGHAETSGSDPGVSTPIIV